MEVSEVDGVDVIEKMIEVEVEGFGVEIFVVGRGSGGVGKIGGGEGSFYSGAGVRGEFLTGGGAAFEDFDTVVGIGVMGGGDVDGEIEAHFVETVVDSGGGEDAGGGIFEAESFTGSGEVL